MEESKKSKFNNDFPLFLFSVQDFLDKAKKDFEDNWSKNPKVSTGCKEKETVREKQLFKGHTVHMYIHCGEGFLSSHQACVQSSTCMLVEADSTDISRVDHCPSIVQH